MRTVTETKELYKFNELSDDAKEHAVAEYLQHWYDQDWAEFTLDDAYRIGKLFGLDMAKYHSSPEINWDVNPVGAAYAASYQYVKGCVAAVKREAPHDTKLHDIVSRLADAQRVLRYSGNARCSASGLFQRVDVSSGVRKAESVTDAEAEIHDALCDYADWIARGLMSEYEYVTSVEYIAEIFECNEYEFDVDGRIA